MFLTDNKILPDRKPKRGHYLQDAWAQGTVIVVIANPDHGSGKGKRREGPK